MKIYLVVPAELDIEGNIESLDLTFSRVFTNKVLANNCLKSWIDDILSQDEELVVIQNSDTEYVIEKHTQTDWEDDFKIPCYKFWILEKETEA